MKAIEVKPKDLVFTRWSEFESFSSLEQVPKSEYWKVVPPIIVLKHPQKKAYLIYNGNHRAMVAKNKKLKVRALLVESEEDLPRIPPEESMYESAPEHYQKYDAAIKRLIQKSEVFCKKQTNSKDSPEAEHHIKIMPFIKNNVSLLKKNGCKKVLELSLGTGINSIYLSKKGFMVYGIDSSGTMIHIAQNLINQNSIKDLVIKKGNMRNIPFKDNEFCAVIASSGLSNQTMDQAKKTVKETHRVLRKDGLFIFNVLAKSFPGYGEGILVEKDTFIDSRSSDGGMPRHYFSKEEIEQEIAPQFKMLKSYPDYSYNGQIKSSPMKWNIVAKKEELP